MINLSPNQLLLLEIIDMHIVLHKIKRFFTSDFMMGVYFVLLVAIAMLSMFIGLNIQEARSEEITHRSMCIISICSLATYHNSVAPHSDYILESLKKSNLPEYLIWLPLVERYHITNKMKSQSTSHLKILDMQLLTSLYEKHNHDIDKTVESYILIRYDGRKINMEDFNNAIHNAIYSIKCLKAFDISQSNSNTWTNLYHGEHCG